MPPLDHASPVPLYAQLIDRIRGQIETGNWTAASRIPSERKLCALFDVSRVTVRQAVQVLVREGLLVLSSGRGTYIADQVSSPIGETNRIAADGHLLQHGTHPGGWRFEPSESVPAHVPLALGVNDGVALTCLSRWRESGLRETVYLVNDRCPGLRTYHHNEVALYETLRRYYGIAPDRATLQWYAPASSEVAKDIRLGAHTLVLRIQQTTFDRDGRAFEHVEVHRMRRGDERSNSSSRKGHSS